MKRELPQVGKEERASFLPTLRTIDEKARTIDFVASTPTADRYGDSIKVEGWKLDSYRKNPVFLFGHRSQDPPIGKCTKVWTEQNPPALCQTIQFADAVTYPFADTIFRLYVGGYLRAVSVGFMPLEQPVPMKDADGYTTGYEFNGQELLELSAVPVPANPEALARAVNSGVVTEADVKKLFRDEPAEPAEDEQPSSVVDHIEELGEALDEIAAAVADAQKLCAVIEDQLEPGNMADDSAKLSVSKQKNATVVQDGSVSGILARIVESRNRPSTLPRQEIAALKHAGTPKAEEKSPASDETEITTLEQLGEGEQEITTLAQLGEALHADKAITTVEQLATAAA